MLRIIANPDKEKFEELGKAVKANDGYCPCMVFKTEDTRCICVDFRKQETPGPCHCGRYIKVEVK